MQKEGKCCVIGGSYNDGGAIVYSTNLKDNRYLVRCLTVAENTYVNEFVVDTGAKYTCLANCVFVDRAMTKYVIQLRR